MSFLIAVILVVIVFSVITSVTRAVLNSGRSERPLLEAADGPGLAEDQEQDFGDLCADSTSLCLQLYKDYGDILQTLKRKDGFSPIEGKEALRKATTGAAELLERVGEVAEMFDWMPSDAEDYLSFLHDNAEFLVELDDEDGRLFEIGNDNLAAAGVVSQAQERVGTMLLASFDFGRRMLDFRVGEYVEQQHGKDMLKLWRSAVHDAEKAM